LDCYKVVACKDTVGCEIETLGLVDLFTDRLTVS